MISLDTNVLLRVLLDDDATQGAIARELLASHSCYVSDTVVLEISWVLLRLLKIPRNIVYGTLSQMLSIATLNFDDRAALEVCLCRFQMGMDLPDAMHLMSSERAKVTSLATFDQAFIKAAAALQTPIPVNHPQIGTS